MTVPVKEDCNLVVYHCDIKTNTINKKEIQYFLPTTFLTCPGHDPLELLDSDPPI